MALLVNVRFGGRVQASWSSIGTVLTTYQQVATQYGLTKPHGGFTLEFQPGTGDLDGATFWYEKRGTPESNLQVFNDLWKSIADQYSIARHSTKIEYYEG